MTKQPHSSNAQTETALHVFGAELSLSNANAPDWITLFSKIGKITTLDGRSLDVDADALIKAFSAQGIYVPIDVNHATEIQGSTGGRADAVGWIVELKMQDSALMGRVEWLDEGRDLVVSKKYRYTSPAVYSSKSTGKTTAIKSVALVTSPALGGQPTLNQAQNKQSDPNSPNQPVKETPMKSVLLALGLPEDTNETQCLSALTALKQTAATAIPQVIHEKVLQQLNAASAELDTLKSQAYKTKVDALLEGALKDKKIVPAERPDFEALCATEEGFTNVEKLFARKAPQLTPSSLETAKMDAGTGELTPVQLAAKAQDLQKLASGRGETLSIADAMAQIVHV